MKMSYSSLVSRDIFSSEEKTNSFDNWCWFLKIISGKIEEVQNFDTDPIVRLPRDHPLLLICLFPCPIPVSRISTALTTSMEKALSKKQRMLLDDIVSDALPEIAHGYKEKFYNLQNR